MQTFKTPQTKKDFNTIIDAAQKNGFAMIQWSDGTIFSLRRESVEKSPFDVPGIKIDITRDEIVEIVREGRAR